MIIPVGYAQVNFMFDGAALPSGAEMTLGYDIGSGSSTPLELAEAVRDAWNSSDIDQYYVPAVTMRTVLAKFGPTETGPSAEAEANAVGTADGEGEAPQVAALVRKHTALGGRAGRGRMYFPGMPQAQVAQNGGMSDLWITGIATQLNAIVAQVALGGDVPVLLHGAGSPISLPTPITTFSVAARCATQRRRNRPD